MKRSTCCWFLVFGLLSGCGGDSKRPDAPDYEYDGPLDVVCEVGAGTGDVAEPEFVTNLNGQTSWFAGPVVADLNGDGTNELVAAYYDIYVFDASYNLLHQTSEGSGRVYAPHVVADLDGDGTMEVVAGKDHQVWAWEWNGAALAPRAGWPADTTTAGEAPEVRGLAAADLDGDGTIEVVASTTQTQTSASGGAQIFVFSADGSSYQPAGGHAPAWPRYNALAGAGNDADRNGQGHNGFGCYGLNVGIGNIDDDSQLEILATYDNHHIQAFHHDGVAIDAAPYFTNRQPDHSGQRMTWGQFIRWADPQVEEDHYNLHTGDWPHPDNQEWLQWTASPPGVADLDGDGRNEVIGVPNVEMHTPYVTQSYAVMVLDGAYGTGERSAMRHNGFETMPRGGVPIQVSGWYPPGGVPAAALVNLLGDAQLEIVTSLNDGQMYAIAASGEILWSFDYTFGKAIMYASEPLVADLSGDGIPEVVFSTYGSPEHQDSGRLVILDAGGRLLHGIPLPDPGSNGNGSGAPAAPTIADIDGDGQLEIFVQTFDHGMDVFTIPGSETNCLLWTTARGNRLRTGSAD